MADNPEEKAWWEEWKACQSGRYRERKPPVRQILSSTLAHEPLPEKRATAGKAAERFDDTEDSQVNQQSAEAKAAYAHRRGTAVRRFNSIFSRFETTLAEKDEHPLSDEQMTNLRRAAERHRFKFYQQLGVQQHYTSLVHCAGPAPAPGRTAICPETNSFSWADPEAKASTFQMDHQPSFDSTVRWWVEGVDMGGDIYASTHTEELAFRLFGAVLLRCKMCHPSGMRQIRRDMVIAVVEGRVEGL